MINPSNFNKPVPKFWYRVLIVVHSLTMISAITTAVKDYPWVSLGILVTGYVTDMIIRFIRQDNPNIDEPTE